jgi:hypothetical protein
MAKNLKTLSVGDTIVMKDGTRETVEYVICGGTYEVVSNKGCSGIIDTDFHSEEISHFEAKTVELGELSDKELFGKK